MGLPLMQSHAEVFRCSWIELWCSYNTQCQCLFVWLKHCVWGLVWAFLLCGWLRGHILTYTELRAEYILFLMVIMEHVILFSLVKYYNVVLKTGQCTPSKNYPNAFHFVMTKSTEPYTCYIFKCDILCMLYVVSGYLYYSVNVVPAMLLAQFICVQQYL